MHLWILTHTDHHHSSGCTSLYRRARYGRTFFFTVVTHGRRSILCEDRSRGVLREVLREARQARPFTIEAWVLLADHIHCIWTLPEDDTNYSMRWGWIKKEFTKRVRITVGDGVGDGKEEMVGAAHQNWHEHDVGKDGPRMDAW